jgi:hypothetical protein
MESFDTFLILDTQSNIGTTTECILKRCAEPKTRSQLKASDKTWALLQKTFISYIYSQTEIDIYLLLIGFSKEELFIDWWGHCIYIYVSVKSSLYGNISWHRFKVVNTILIVDQHICRLCKADLIQSKFKYQDMLPYNNDLTETVEMSP